MENYLNIFYGYFIFYILLGFYLLRSTPTSYDLLKIRLRFLPFYARWLGVLIIIAGIITFFYFEDFEGLLGKKEFFFYNLNTGLLFFILSKERNEDELFLHLRMKALVVSFIHVIVLVGMFYALFFKNNGTTGNGIFGLGLFLFIFQIYYLVYFYYSKYKSQKEQQ